MDKRLLSLVLTTAAFFSCAPARTVDVVGSQKAGLSIPPHVTYAVLPIGDVEHDPNFPRYAKSVAQQLDRRGYRQTEPKVARLGVYLGYGVRKISYDAQGSPPLGQQAGGAGGMIPGSSSYGTAVSGTSMGAAPAYVTYLVIVLVDLGQSTETGSLLELWRGESKTRGSATDVPAAMPMLVEAAFRHFGQTTPSTVSHVFSEEDLKKAHDGGP